MEFVEHQQYKLYYEKTGNKNQVILLFHGFGQTHKHLQPIVDQMISSYTCYNFDLFYHGKSSGPEDQPLELDTWNSLFEKFIKKENIDRINLIGFSLGSKYILAIMMAHSQKTDLIYFLAPDGIKTNIWYTLATYPYPLRKYFRSMIRHPQRFYVLLRIFKNLGFVSREVTRFVELQMHSPDKRMQVFKTWVGIRHIKFNNNKILKVINDNRITVNILIGKKDKIIPLKSFQRFCDRSPTTNLVILEAGHYDLIKAASTYISKKISAS